MATQSPSSDATGQHADQSLTRYDLLLAAMPVPMAAGAAAAAASSLPSVSGLGVGALLSATLVVYGLFCEPPAA